MSPRRRSLRRPIGRRRYRKLFVVSPEGTKTEPQYFELLNSQFAVVRILCIGHRGGRSPDKVLKAMDNYLRGIGLRKSDEAWLVIDRDRWRSDAIDRLQSWACSHRNTHLAVSNPCFEYWLLLHFDDGDRIAGRRGCINRLKRYLPAYDKSVRSCDISLDTIKAAVERAKKRHLSQGDPPRTNRVWVNSVQASREYSE
jgi:hypothetical protein